MELIIVKKQAQGTMLGGMFKHFEPQKGLKNHEWMVESKLYPTMFGGLQKWYDYLLDKEFDYVYLYSITAIPSKIVNGSIDNLVDDIIYNVRADYKYKK